MNPLRTFLWLRGSEILQKFSAEFYQQDHQSNTIYLIATINGIQTQVGFIVPLAGDALVDAEFNS